MVLHNRFVSIETGREEPESPSGTDLGQETVRRIGGVGMVKHLVLIRGVDGGFACVTQGGCNLFQYRLRVVRRN